MTLLSNDNVTAIINAIVGAGRDGGIDLVNYANDEAQAYASCCEGIAQLLNRGVIDNVTATEHVEAFKATEVYILQNIHQMHIVLAKQIVNAGLKAIGGILNGVIGLKIFPE